MNPAAYDEEVQEDIIVPSRNHARAAQNVGLLLARHAPGLEVFQTLSLDLDGWKTIPDVCAFARDRPAQGWSDDEEEVSIPPDLAVEILSPRQSLGPLVDKVRECLRRGVKSCWIVAPSLGSVSVFSASGERRSFGDGRFRDDALGIEAEVSEVFR